MAFCERKAWSKNDRQSADKCMQQGTVSRRMILFVGVYQFCILLLQQLNVVICTAYIRTLS